MGIGNRVYTFNDVQIAKQTMSLRSVHGAVAMLVTVWKGNMLLITWDRSHGSIMFDPSPYYLDEVFNEEDEMILTQLVREHFVNL